MRCNVVLTLVAALMLGAAPATGAVEKQSAELDLTKQTDATTEADYFDLDGPVTLAAAVGSRLTSAYLELHMALEPGQEVELWLDTGTERKPWERREDYGLRKAHWVADERTGSLVRLDMTELVRTWTAAPEAKHPKLLIRVAPDGEGIVTDLRPTGLAKAKLVIRSR